VNAPVLLCTIARGCPAPIQPSFNSIARCVNQENWDEPQAKDPSHKKRRGAVEVAGGDGGVLSECNEPVEQQTRGKRCRGQLEEALSLPSLLTNFRFPASPAILTMLVVMNRFVYCRPALQTSPSTTSIRRHRLPVPFPSLPASFLLLS
jgi:hypothetical protein